MAEIRKNVGEYDRAVRATIGIVALAVGVAGIAGIGGVGETLGMYVSVVVGVAGVISLFTAATGFCGAYTLLGVDTCGVDE
jgi:hypothetical protein